MGKVLALQAWLICALSSIPRTLLKNKQQQKHQAWWDTSEIPVLGKRRQANPRGSLAI